MGTPLARLRSSLHSSLRLPVDNSKLMQTNKCIGRQAQEESSYWLLRAAHQTPAMIVHSLHRQANFMLTRRGFWFCSILVINAPRHSPPFHCHLDCRHALLRAGTERSPYSRQVL